MPPTADTITASAQFIAGNLQLVNRLAEDWKTYYTGQISPEGIVHWLLQFREPNSVQIALRLLERIHFIDESRLAHLLLEALKKVPSQHREAAVFAPAGKAHDSAAHVGYILSKALGYPESELSSRWKNLADIEVSLVEEQSIPAIILFDDNITSGTQLDRLLRELFPSFTDKREHISRPWSEAALRHLKNIPIHIIVAMELAEGSAFVQTTATELGLSVAIHSGYCDRVKWLEYGGPIWPSKEKAQEATSLVSEISRKLFADKEHWSPSTLEKRLLGYGNDQKLTVFQHSTPKSLLPPFWKFGQVDGMDWFPLFADRGEWEKHSARIQNANPPIRAIARLIATGVYGQTAPSNSVFISLNGDPTTNLDIAFPDPESLGNSFQHLSANLPWPDKEPLLPSFLATAADTASSALSTLLPLPLPALGHRTPRRVEEYNQAADNYKKLRREKWAPQVSKSLRRAARTFSIPLRVYNNGTRKATGTFLLLELPAGLEWSQTKPFFPTPPQPPDPPENSLSLKLPPHESTLRRELRAKLLSGAPPLTPRVAQEEILNTVKLSRDRGRNILSIHFGSILQGTFRDRTLAFLRATNLGHFSIAYKLYCEEVPTPTEGAFLIKGYEARLDPRAIFHLLDFD